MPLLSCILIRSEGKTGRISALNLSTVEHWRPWTLDNATQMAGCKSTRNPPVYIGVLYMVAPVACDLLWRSTLTETACGVVADVTTYNKPVGAPVRFKLKSILRSSLDLFSASKWTSRSRGASCLRRFAARVTWSLAVSQEHEQSSFDQSSAGMPSISFDRWRRDYRPAGRDLPRDQLVLHPEGPPRLCEGWRCSFSAFYSQIPLDLYTKIGLYGGSI